VVVTAPICTNLVTSERMNHSVSELLYQSFSKPLWLLGPVLFVAYVKGIWKNIGSTVSLCANGCLIYRDTVNSDHVGKLQIDVGRLWEWAVENGMEKNQEEGRQLASREPGWKTR
jgi:hypothetical protein